MTPDTATNQECRDYIAECRGWSKKTYGPPEYRTPFPVTQWEKDGDVHPSHPVPDDLDAAYAALPPGYVWYSGITQYNKTWAASCCPSDIEEGLRLTGGEEWWGKAKDAFRNAVGDSMKDAMFRAACKAWAVAKGAPR